MIEETIRESLFVVKVSLYMLAALAVAGTLFGIWIGYRNGVVDGYGYSREGPTCPGHERAERFLSKRMRHRWPMVPGDDSPSQL